MTFDIESKRTQDLVWRYAGLALLAWTILAAVSLTVSYRLVVKHNAQMLHHQAVNNFDLDRALRDWNTKHGGTYVPVTPETQPNPYLAHIPERDITTPSGKKLTLMNPAYMTRQIMAQHEDRYGIKGKITALKLLNPSNAPDAWEREALLQLQSGAKEMAELSTIDGKPYMRIMKPLYMEDDCEKCHSYLGFQKGDFRGGIAISIPTSKFLANNLASFKFLAMTHSFGWLLGLLAMAFIIREVRSQTQKNIEAKTALLESEHRLAEIFRISPSALLTTKADGTITEFNEAATKVFGYSQVEALGKSVEILMPEQYRAGHDRRVASFAAPQRSELRMGARTPIVGRRKDGSTFPAAASISKFVIADEIYFAVALHDLTDQLQREADLSEARDLAETANRSKSEFLANMSHEVRTPLTAIKGMLELIDTSHSSEDDKRYLQVARNASDSVLAIINDILDLARLEAGRTELEYTSFELREFVEDIQDLLRGSVEQKGIGFTTDFPGEDPVWIKSDVQRLRQILINLVGNAAKFTDEGEVSLHINVGQQMDNRLDLEISVRDTGIGIRAKDLSRLFERFEQDDSSSTRKHQGTGLGLSICKELTTLMNGVIDASSVYGEGSTFRIRITCEVAEPVKDVTRLAIGPGSETVPLHILVAEDNKVNQLLASKFLERLGHSFDFAENGKEALDAYMNSPSDTHYDVILMDMQMPVMDGAEATRQIRSQSKRPGNVPIIALTADVINLNQDKYRDIELNGYITKPYSLVDLEAELDRVMQEKCDSLDQHNHSDQDTIAS